MIPYMKSRTMLNKAMGTEIRSVFPWKEREQTGKGMKKPPGVTECSISFFSGGGYRGI